MTIQDNGHVGINTTDLRNGMLSVVGGPCTSAGCHSGDGGTGVVAYGGEASVAGAYSGWGLYAGAGSVSNGASRVPAIITNGNVSVQGDLNVTGNKNFKIDHPSDPENKYLLHAAVESSEVLNLYSGNVTTDEQGKAVVELPDWFEALNQDFRYQLTVINTFAQAIIAEKIKGNRFVIQTNAPGVEVSWQVTGVRSDAYMLKHPFKVEEKKPERERGTYLSPEAFGQPEEKGVMWAVQPELMRQLKERREKAARQ